MFPWIFQFFIAITSLNDETLHESEYIIIYNARADFHISQLLSAQTCSTDGGQARYSPARKKQTI